MVTRAQIQAARVVDLYDWALRHPDLFEAEGRGEGASLRLKSNHSISIKQGYCGYKDFAAENDESRAAKGNSIDFLVKHLGYDFVSAVKDLLKGEAVSCLNVTEEGTPPPRAFELPQKADNQRRLFAYLCKTRGIPAAVVQSLLDLGYIYQDTRGNIVFHGREDWAELHGTLSPNIAEKAYKGIVSGSIPSGSWFFKVGDNPAACYICEAAIDAISLAVILGASAFYISIGGAGKQSTIDRVKAGKLPAIIAVDNDKAGDACAARNDELERLVPSRKDWNEDLLAGAEKHDIIII